MENLDNNEYNNKYNDSYDNKYNEPYDTQYNNQYDNQYNNRYDNRYDNMYNYKTTQGNKNNGLIIAVSILGSVVIIGMSPQTFPTS